MFCVGAENQRRARRDRSGEIGRKRCCVIVRGTSERGVRFARSGCFGFAVVGAAVKPSATPVEEMASLVSETPDVVEAPAVEDNNPSADAEVMAEVTAAAESIANDMPVEAVAEADAAPAFPVAFDDEEAVVASDSALLDSQKWRPCCKQPVKCLPCF